jgi:hypothetical protein
MVWKVVRFLWIKVKCLLSRHSSSATNETHEDSQSNNYPPISKVPTHSVLCRSNGTINKSPKRPTKDSSGLQSSSYRFTFNGLQQRNAYGGRATGQLPNLSHCSGNRANNVLQSGNKKSKLFVVMSNREDLAEIRNTCSLWRFLLCFIYASS